MIRKAFPLLAALSLALIAPLAQAQVSLYGTITLNHLTGIQSSPVLQTLSPLPCTGTTTVNCTAYNDTVNPIGFTGGLSYDFKSFDRFTLGVDARGVLESDHRGAQTFSDGAGTRIYSGLGGLKVTFRTPFDYLKPYAQVSGGYARSNYGVLTNAAHSGTTYPTNPTLTGIPTQNGVAYHVFAGTDLRALPWLDWRVVELGYGGIHSTGTYSHTYPIYSVSTGIVLHFARP